jgi:TPR repeat protein
MFLNCYPHGRCFLNGKGCEKNAETALTWFKRRNPSCAGSQYNIGLFYAHGLGGELQDDRGCSEAMGKYQELRMKEKTRFEVSRSGAWALDHA